MFISLTDPESSNSPIFNWQISLFITTLPELSSSVKPFTVLRDSGDLQTGIWDAILPLSEESSATGLHTMYPWG